MSYFAYVPDIVDGKGIVEQVIRIDEETLKTGAWGDPAKWVQTSYNTRGGVHYGPDGQPDGGVALRANYAGIGDTYDSVNDVFYNPQPYPSWLISGPAWGWVAPVPIPQDGKQYVWDETTLSWDIPPQPYPSWTLDTATNEWIPPVPVPQDGKVYYWDEAILNWVLAP